MITTHFMRKFFRTQGTPSLLFAISAAKILKANNLQARPYSSDSNKNNLPDSKPLPIVVSRLADTWKIFLAIQVAEKCTFKTKKPIIHIENFRKSGVNTNMAIMFSTYKTPHNLRAIPARTRKHSAKPTVALAHFDLITLLPTQAFFCHQ